MCASGLRRKFLEHFVSSSSEETLLFGKKISKNLGPGSILALLGNLGTGKTTLVKGIVQALFPSLEKEIQSPTFTYLHMHESSCPIYHFDLYRIRDEKEFSSLGLEEYFYKNGICLIEWADPILSLLPRASLIVEIFHKEETSRHLQLFCLE